jgi:hypothetical protein
MTLNVTLLTQSRIYQSADFRLTNPESNRVITDQSTKLVTLLYPKSFWGLVTYTGVGSWSGKDTSLWITDWLAGKSDLGLADLAEHIAEEGTAWLQTIERATGQRYRHTFLIAGYVGDYPEFAVVSNFEDAIGQITISPSVSLMTTRRRVRNRALAIVTGAKPSVTRDGRKRLQRLANTWPEDSARIRNAMMTLNQVAAQSPAARDLISEDCTVVSIDSGGQGFQDVTPEGRVQVRAIFNGMAMPDLSRLAGELGIPSPRIIGATFGIHPSRQPSPTTCHPSVDVPDASHAYSLDEIAALEFDTMVARAIGRDGFVVGAGTLLGNRAEYHYWIWHPQSGMTRLPFVGGGSLGMDLVDASHAAITNVLPDGCNRAVRWKEDSGTDLGVHRGRDSGAQAINLSGTVAGWVCIDSDQRGQMNFRPAVWLADNSVHVLDDLPGDWGEAIDINDSGSVLLWLHRGFASHAHLWQPGAAVAAIGGQHGAGVIPVGINESGRILGFGRDGQGRAIALISDGGGTWSPLGTDAGWSPTAIGNDGSVVGFVEREGFGRPWMRQPSGDLVMLPYFRYHHHRPFGIGDRGDVVGEAMADHGTHALVWNAPT